MARFINSKFPNLLYDLDLYSDLGMRSVSRKRSANSVFPDMYKTSSTFAAKEIGRKLDELTDKGMVLTDGSENSPFHSEEEYDPQKAYSSVKEFVDKYNDVMKLAKNSTDHSVDSMERSMTRISGIMRKKLAEIGIKVNLYGRLTLQEDLFKKADYKKVKSVLGSSKSYTSMISKVAEQSKKSVSKEQLLNINNMYGRNGKYSGRNNNGSWFNFFS